VTVHINTRRMTLEKHLEAVEDHLRSFREVLRGKGDFQPGACWHLQNIICSFLRVSADEVEKPL